MNAVLLIVERPDQTTNPGIQAWQRHQQVLAAIAAHSQRIEVLGDNLWLIPLDSELSTFVDLVREARDLKLTCRALFFQDALQWVRMTP